MRTYGKADIIKNINFDIIDLYDAQRGDVKLEALVLTIAVPCCILDYNKTPLQELKKIMKSIKSYLRRTKFRLEAHGKLGLYNKLRDEWMPAYEETDEMISLISGDFSIIQDFAEDGKPVFNEKIMQTYRGIKAQKTNTIIEYPEVKFSRRREPSTPTGPIVDFVLEEVNGVQSVSLPLTTDDWRDIMLTASPKAQAMVVLFLDMPDYAASCLQIEKKFGICHETINIINTLLGIKVTKQRRFIIKTASGEAKYWPVAMSNGQLTSEGFVWQLRPELAQAAETLRSEQQLPSLEESYKILVREEDTVLNWKVTNPEKQAETLRPFIEEYKKNWKYIHENEVYAPASSNPHLKSREGYKWVSSNHFINTFKIDASDIVDNLHQALAYSSVLLAGPHYFPKDTLEKDAKVDPKGVRDALAVLFDESQALSSRMLVFLSRMDKIHRTYSTTASQQSTRSASVYLAMMYPNRHYLFKNRMLFEFLRETGLDVQIPSTGPYLKIAAYERLCDWIRSILMQDEELLALNDTTYPYDPSDYHLLTQDFIYFVQYHYRVLKHEGVIIDDDEDVEY